MDSYSRRIIQVAAFAALSIVFVLASTDKALTQDATFVGSETCGECHDVEFENYTSFSKKAHSGDSVKIMAGDLTSSELEECYSCHMTGYGQPGGFISFDETPDMANAGCETCHGPGSAHVDAGGDPDYIKANLDVDDCTHCHNSERVAAFDFKPMLFGGAH
ncbi:MAG: cytochrome c family protein [Proteobacteria bacterium]|nr:cytochrome c family protein [Pseudomonadota bacterium]MBU1610907.1 cytochrome c family protein [Pseudomonadota bacterium]